MLVGTVLGVLVIPGLYYLFGKLADGRKLLAGETDEPLSEHFERNPLEADDEAGGQSPHATDPTTPRAEASSGNDEGELPEATEIPSDEPPNPERPPGGTGS